MQKTGRADMPMNEMPFDIEGYYRQNFPPGMSEAKLKALHQAMVHMSRMP